MSPRKVICSGFSSWKRSFLPAFLSLNQGSAKFIDSPQMALESAAKNRTSLVLWASAETDDLRSQALKLGVPLLRVEDAFLRSVGLGSNLVRPQSLVLDDLGIYYDCSRPSRLESILREQQFSDTLVERAHSLHQLVVAKGLTKYNVGIDEELVFANEGRVVILVPGQVEDDASILRGSPNIKRNLDLLMAVKGSRPEAYIVFKPHPDVLVGNRKGAVDTDEALKFADQVVTDISMGYLLNLVDEVHTMTSLAGFEALLRGCHVVTYGLPFYSGWGLTEDRMPCPRRGRRLTLPQLIAGALILYPTYVDNGTGEICSVEDVVDSLSGTGQDGKKLLRRSSRFRRFLDNSW